MKMKTLPNENEINAVLQKPWRVHEDEGQVWRRQRIVLEGGEHAEAFMCVPCYIWAQCQRCQYRLTEGVAGRWFICGDCRTRNETQFARHRVVITDEDAANMSKQQILERIKKAVRP